MAEQLGLDLADVPRRAKTAVLRSAHFRGHVAPLEAVTIDARAAGQEASILSWLRGQGPGKRFAPSDVHAAFPRLEITSVRRALTTMTVKGLLVHHEHDRRPGPRGGTESVWGLA